ncbi:hypothetical protein Btru_033051 [Bulinus truncatus]|nr:hypothetical protein Btru_033051 [Bulinus truncatus]
MGSPVVVASPRKSPSYNRRANKPLVEKKRRARINGCLGQLKSLILGAMQTEGAQVSRLEKADILEMTVKYLRHVQSQQVAPEPEVVTKFSAGYTECASEVIRYIDAVNCVSPDVRAKLENHLVERLRGSFVPTPTQTPTQALPVQQQQQQHMNPPTQYAHATFQPSQTTSPAVNDILCSRPAQSVNDNVLSYQNDIDVANKAAAEALKRQAPVSVSSPPRVSVMGIRQNAQAAPVSPKRSSSPPPKSDAQERNDLLFSQLKARQESHLHQVVHPVPRLARSQSTSPLHVRQVDDNIRVSSVVYGGERERRCSGEQTFHPSSHYTPAPTYNNHTAYSPTAYGHEAYISNTVDKQSNMCSVKSETENYFSDYERPLHIHIPDSPRIPATPSPPFYPPGISYQPAQPQDPSAIVSPRNTSCPSLDESPPTILYGYSQIRSSSPVYKMETEEITQYSANTYSSRYSDYEQESVQCLMSYELANDSRDHLQNRLQGAKRTVASTPSPPTLTREEPFIDHSTRPHLQVSHHQSESCNELTQNTAGVMLAQHCYMREPAHYTSPQTSRDVYPAYRNQYSGHLNRDNQYCDQISAESNQRHSSDDMPSHQQHNSGHQSQPDVRVKREPALQPESKIHHNEQPAVNGSAPSQPIVQSRQKDTPLSLLTLKRRILYGLGSEGEWTASGKTAEQQKCTQDNRADDCETRALPRKERDLITPAAILCRASTQCAADDTVWRPW